MLKKYRCQGPSPDQGSQNLWAWGQGTVLFKHLWIISMSSQGENTDPCHFVFEPPREWISRTEFPVPSGHISMMSIFWSNPPQVCTRFVSLRSSLNASRMYRCLRNSLRGLQVHGHDCLDFFEPQRELTPGRHDKGSTSSPRDRSHGCWPPLALMILENQSQLLPDQAVCEEAPYPPVSSFSAPCSPHRAFPNPAPGSSHPAWPLQLLHFALDEKTQVQIRVLDSVSLASWT